MHTFVTRVFETSWNSFPRDWFHNSCGLLWSKLTFKPAWHRINPGNCFPPQGSNARPWMILLNHQLSAQLLAFRTCLTMHHDHWWSIGQSGNLPCQALHVGKYTLHHWAMRHGLTNSYSGCVRAVKFEFGGARPCSWYWCMCLHSGVPIGIVCYSVPLESDATPSTSHYRGLTVREIYLFMHFLARYLFEQYHDSASWRRHRDAAEINCCESIFFVWWAEQVRNMSPKPVRTGILFTCQISKISPESDLSYHNVQFCCYAAKKWLNKNKALMCMWIQILEETVHVRGFSWWGADWSTVFVGAGLQVLSTSGSPRSGYDKEIP